MLLTGLFTSKDFPAIFFTVGEKAMSKQTNNQTVEIKEAIHMILTFSLHSDNYLCTDPVVSLAISLDDAVICFIRR